MSYLCAELVTKHASWTEFSLLALRAEHRSYITFSVVQTSSRLSSRGNTELCSIFQDLTLIAKVAEE